MTAMAAVLLSAASLTVFAQGGYQVKGVVVDAVGPVIGATVIEQGTNNGVSTGLDGDYVLNVSNADAVVEISCIGYATQTFKASAMPSTVTLAEDAEFLDDVVVIGYGTVRKDDLTGSVATVKADDLNKGAVTTPADLIRGKSAGVVVTSGSGQPGSGATIRVRGGSSLSATNDPLIVIDGLPVSNESISGMSDPLSSINPSDIESFTVLKDASATAIYGSRASNGVIVITTKKGSKGSKAQFSLDYQHSLATVQKYVDVMNAAEIKSAIQNHLSGETQTQALAALGTSDTNWQKEIYHMANSDEVNFSVRGDRSLGSLGNMPLRFSAGYINQDGILRTSNMKRATASLNATPTLLDNHLTISLNGKVTYQHNNYANQDAIGAALRYDPTQSVYDASGLNGYTTWYDLSGNVNTMATQNPVALLYEKYDKANANRFIGNAQFDYKIHGFEDLRLNLNLGLDWAKSDGQAGTAAGTEQSLHDTTQSGDGYSTDYNYLRRDQTLEAYADYSHTFGEKHYIDLMGGYSWQHFWNKSYTFSQTVEDVRTLADTPFATEYYLVSFFGRFNYGFGDKYLLTATIRRDGTSRFQNNKWGLFPSVAFAWNIKNEGFLKEQDALSTAKLRLSWGQTGQQDLNAGNYPTLGTYYSNLIGSYYKFGGTVIYPVTALGYNADLKWETTTTYNVGVDLGFLRDRLTISADAYLRKTEDLINRIPVSAGANLTNYLTSNIGSLENKGVEVDVNAIIISTQNTSWTLGVNGAYNHNEITKLTAAKDDDSGVLTGSISGATGNNVQIHHVGYAANSFYVYEQLYDTDGNPIDGAYVDRNGDGILNDSDLYIFHKPSADVTLGVNSTFTYKNFSAAVSGHGSFGNYNYNNVASDQEMWGDLWTNSFVSNRLTSAEASNFSNARYLSDYYVRDASFFKIDNVTLGYTFPDIFTIPESFGSPRTVSLNIFGTVQNVCTFTDYDGIDPEVYGGIDGEVYPRPRTFILGLKLNF